MFNELVSDSISINDLGPPAPKQHDPWIFLKLPFKQVPNPLRYFVLLNCTLFNTERLFTIPYLLLATCTENKRNTVDVQSGKSDVQFHKSPKLTYTILITCTCMEHISKSNETAAYVWLRSQ